LWPIHIHTHTQTHKHITHSHSPPNLSLLLNGDSSNLMFGMCMCMCVCVFRSLSGMHVSEESDWTSVFSLSLKRLSSFRLFEFTIGSSLCWCECSPCKEYCTSHDRLHFFAFDFIITSLFSLSLSTTTDNEWVVRSLTSLTHSLSLSLTQVRFMHEEEIVDKIRELVTKELESTNVSRTFYSPVTSLSRALALFLFSELSQLWPWTKYVMFFVCMFFLSGDWFRFSDGVITNDADREYNLFFNCTDFR
jgi:hypothetical protein